MNKHLIQNLLLPVLLLITCSSYASLDGDSHWVVENGDSVYLIARTVFPDDANKRRQFRQELVKGNPSVFNGNANRMGVGQRLLLPAFAVNNSVPIVVTAASIEVQVPKAAEEEKKIVSEEVVPATVITPVVEKQVVTLDPEDVIGQVVISVGGMQANNRGSFRKLLRHSEILKGDTLTTEKNAYTQIRMKDGALISLRPNTELKITDYHFNGTEDGSEKSVMELINGGFRTITGLIGHRNKQNYSVKTAVATIGIRGTHYGLMICSNSSCSGESSPLEDGVYGGVVDGSIVVENEAGIATFNNDQYFYVASALQSPTEQLLPPPVFHGKAEGRRKDSNGEGVSKQDSDRPGAAKRVSGKSIKGDRLGPLVREVISDYRPLPVLPDQSDPIKDTPKIRLAPNGSGMLVAFTEIRVDQTGVTGPSPATAPIVVLKGNNNEIVLGSKIDVGGAVIENLPIAVHEESDGKVHNLILPSGATGIKGIGGNSIGVNWGRWTGNYELTENGAQIQTIGDLHYVYSDKLTTPAELSQISALGGLTAVSYIDVGGTLPTNNAGLQTQLNSISVVSDFVNQEIVSYVLDFDNAGTPIMMDLGIDQVTGNAITVPFFSNTGEDMRGFSLQPGISSLCTACTGSATSAFIGSNAEGMITTFSVQETGGSKGANGAAVLTRTNAAGVPLQ